MFHTTGLTMIRLSVPVLSLLCMPTPGSSSDASGVHRHEKVSKRLVSLQTMSLATERAIHRAFARFYALQTAIICAVLARPWLFSYSGYTNKKAPTIT
jgi:hypothetical protein